MPTNATQLSNPFSTGGGGVRFETQVQASFLALMLTGGYAPCLPCWPIDRIKLQGKCAGYDTDDLVVFVRQPGASSERKLLAQIKHAVAITENDKVFGDVIQAAWRDFRNDDLFATREDALALITGPLSATDISDVRPLLEWARHSADAEEFFDKVELRRFISRKKQAKLAAFRKNVDRANGGESVSDEELYEFLRNFHLLGYDLDIRAGVTLSLLHSLIGRSSLGDAKSLWSRLLEEVQSFNQNAGTITSENVDEDLVAAFRQPAPTVIPLGLSADLPAQAASEWMRDPRARNLAIADLLGSWDERRRADIEIVAELAGQSYSDWIPSLREVLLEPESPLSLKEGVWRVTARSEFWMILARRLFDDDLERFAKAAHSVLAARDPQYDLPAEDRYAASIHGKVLAHSRGLRRGMVEGLALLGSRADDLVNASLHRPEGVAAQVVRDLLLGADWVLWASLDQLLPAMAEAAPDAFMNAVEAALQTVPCPYDELFSQEGTGFMDRTYLSGLLWALETLAWDEKHLVRVVVILGDLAARDPGGNWANRPASSLTSILLPWLPQTDATIEKRKVAVETLKEESPTVAWCLLLSLLPKQQQISSGTRKPKWRNLKAADQREAVTRADYWEQVSAYADLAVSMAEQDIHRLQQLVGHMDALPQPSLDRVLEYLSSQAMLATSEEERLPVWMDLSEFILRHKRYAGAEWALSADATSRVEAVAAKLAPTNPLNLHRRLFSQHFHGEEGDSWEEQELRLRKARDEAVAEIVEYGGFEAAVRFAATVDLPELVGLSLAAVAGSEADAIIVSSHLGSQTDKLARLAGGFVRGRHHRDGWAWADSLERSAWSPEQTAELLSELPFDREAWSRASAWLDEAEGAYWTRTGASPYGTDGDLDSAIGKLIEYGRPIAAIDCLHYTLNQTKALNEAMAVRALLSLPSSDESPNAVDAYDIVEVLKSLQDDPNLDPDDLLSVEWALLPLLDGHHGATPKSLHSRLASDPEFFCEVIRLVYRSKKAKKAAPEPSERERSMATNAWSLLYRWQTPPGMQSDGTFDSNAFGEWLKQVKVNCAESGHLEVALTHLGSVLFYTPEDSGGLWIDCTVASALNARDADHMRNGFCTDRWPGRSGQQDLVLR